jgi:glutathione synthase/RimK-type ligase-like ATP-grasp enzyme
MKAQIRTKNFSAKPLRGAIVLPFSSIVRLGSTTPTNHITNKRVIECNVVEAIENSRNKLRMKNCFSRFNVPQAEMYHGDFNVEAIKKHFKLRSEYKLVGKAIYGFKGHGMVLITSDKELDDFCKTHNPDRFFLEVFHNLSREYRLHCTQDQVFLSWRKLRKSDAEKRWFFNSENCNWIGEDNPLFNKPSNWDEICRAAINAITSVGLDIGCADIRVSGEDTSRFIVLEVNSAPALAEIGLNAYKENIKQVLIKKHGNLQS